ncbi:MAG: hypothetical protein ACRYFK_04055 [Janthinobacterium lividum]
MKTCVLAGWLLAGLTACSKKEAVSPAPAPPSTSPAAPVVLQAFTPAAGTLTIQPNALAADTLRGLQLQIVSQANADPTRTLTYTWHGYLSRGFDSLRGALPAGTGMEVVATFTLNNTVALGTGPWHVDVRTNITDANFQQPLGLDYAGQGVLRLTPAGYSLPFTAQFLSGSLTP